MEYVVCYTWEYTSETILEIFRHPFKSGHPRDFDVVTEKVPLACWGIPPVKPLIVSEEPIHALSPRRPNLFGVLGGQSGKSHSSWNKQPEIASGFSRNRLDSAPVELHSFRVRKNHCSLMMG